MTQASPPPFDRFFGRKPKEFGLIHLSRFDRLV
jgi:hypothetical protein